MAREKSDLSSNRVSPPNMDPMKAPSFFRMRRTSLKNPGRLLIQCADRELKEFKLKLFSTVVVARAAVVA